MVETNAATAAEVVDRYTFLSWAIENNTAAARIDETHQNQ